jgi:hypothetical protein
MMHFVFNLIHQWPPLAWAAYCSSTDLSIRVFHGAGVETNIDFFCEAVWDGDFEAANFDNTDLVFGSGCRLRSNKALFVSSGSTVDRLHILRIEKDAWISNSLACILTVSNAELDLVNNDYDRQLGTIVKGIDACKKDLKLLQGTVRLIYFNNVEWDGSTCKEIVKLNTDRDFSSFEKYQTFLAKSLNKIKINMSHSHRKFPYRMLGTLSSGYDSSTISVMASKEGLNEVISFANARGGDSDDGHEIAAHLGIKSTVFSRDQWRSENLIEAAFIASDAKGEDVYFSAAGKLLYGRVLLTGFHGDKVWGKETHKLNAFIVRGDRSGLSLAEYRLQAGFIHLPVPFMGVRQIRDINAISKSPEMIRWDIAGQYSRPICRRIVEEAGIERALFGMKKKAASVLHGSGTDKLTVTVRKDLLQWLMQHECLWAGKGCMSPFRQYKKLKLLNIPMSSLGQITRLASRVVPQRFRSYLIRISLKTEKFAPDRYLVKYAFPWAVAKVKENYRAFLVESTFYLKNASASTKMLKH